MREVKFRAWDKGSEYMHSNVQSGVYEDPDEWTEFSTVLGLERFEVMQYTGLKDCDGNEIYEGDVVEDFMNEKRYQVFWDDYGMFIFTELNSTTGGFDYYQLEEEASMDCLMVIGNIYENPELLEVKQ